MDLANIELEEFLKGTKGIAVKIPGKTSQKAIIKKGNKELFWFSKYENLPYLIKDILQGNTSASISPPEATTSETPTSTPTPATPATPAITKLHGKELTQAQMTLLKIKQKFDFFKDMSEEDVLSVTHSVVLMRLDKDEMIFEQGDIGQEVYFVVRGEVDILISLESGSGTLQKYAERTHIATLQTETIFGEMAPITGEPRTARAVSGQSGTTLLSFKINEGKTQGKERAYMILYYNFTKILAHKLAATNRMLLEK